MPHPVGAWRRCLLSPWARRKGASSLLSHRRFWALGGRDDERNFHSALTRVVVNHSEPISGISATDETLYMLYRKKVHYGSLSLVSRSSEIFSTENVGVYNENVSVSEISVTPIGDCLLRHTQHRRNSLLGPSPRRTWGGALTHKMQIERCGVT